MPRPNVLIIMADQFRGDCLGVDGHPDVKTPYLDTLAEKGARFTRAFSATPTCIAARAGLLTGMTPRHHGRIGYQDGVPWTYEHTLPKCFTDAGYQTQCVGKMHVYPLRSRQGFQDVELHDGYLHYFRHTNIPFYEHQLIADDYLYELQSHGHKDITDAGIECNGSVARPWPYEENLHPTYWVADRTIDFLRRRDRDHPFFLMASFVRPHPPFDAPACFFDMYRGKNLRKPPVGDWAAKTGSRVQSSPYGVADPELLTEAQIGYYACITQIDHQIGRILDQLLAEGELNNTYILFISDHGELLGDHNLYRKSLPYEGSARVPFLLSGPGIKAGCVNDSVVELMDVMPTLLDACGIDIPDTVDGKSVMPLLRGETEWRETIHGEHQYESGSAQYIASSYDKFIWYSHTGREQYFDLSSDPQELHNRIDDPACQERIAHLRRCLIEQLTGREEGHTDGERLIPNENTHAILKEVFPDR